MPVVKGVLSSVEYSTDYGSAGAGATWVDIPILQIMENGAQLPREVAQLANTINGQEASAAKANTFALPVALKDSDTFLEALKTAEDEMTPTWFRFTPKGRTARIVGGDVGCLVRVDESPMPQYGQLDMAIIAGSATGASPGDTFEVEGSGS